MSRLKLPESRLKLPESRLKLPESQLDDSLFQLLLPESQLDDSVFQLLLSKSHLNDNYSQLKLTNMYNFKYIRIYYAITQYFKYKRIYYAITKYVRSIIESAYTKLKLIFSRNKIYKNFIYNSHYSNINRDYLINPDNPDTTRV